MRSTVMCRICFFFFFQAEDGIRDDLVTGVQTCALPIFEDASDRQWRVWLGSRNLTRSLNWEAGLVLASQSDGKGQHIPGLAVVWEALAARAKLAPLSAKKGGKELADLTWEGPAGNEGPRVSP